MRKNLHLWIEEYLFFPNTFQKFISFLLLPFTLIYLTIILTKRAFAKQIDFEIPVISIGNLIVGGSGKTPIAIKLSSRYDDVCVVLRGYGRASKGMVVVSNKGEIKVDVKTSGDEAMLLAKSLLTATIIVSEDRKKAIKKAKDLSCKIVFLDDGFSKYDIKKFDILLRAKKEPTNLFCLPSGGYREPRGFYIKADMQLKEGVDFSRIVRVQKDGKDVDFDKNVLLLTAISKPKRLLEFLPKNTTMISFPDHYDFTKQDIDKIKDEYKDFMIVTTAKDMVKLEKFDIPNLYLMNLDIEFSKSVDFSALDNYIKKYI